jgi:hypothetical protein
MLRLAMRASELPDIGVMRKGALKAKKLRSCYSDTDTSGAPWLDIWSP